METTKPASEMLDMTKEETFIFSNAMCENAMV
jgi:hypothetical protein